MEIELRDGKYSMTPDGLPKLLGETEAAFQRAMLRLTAPRGSFLPLPEYGSRLNTLCRLKPGERNAAAMQYVLEALAPEKRLSVKNVEYRALDNGAAEVYVNLLYGEATAEAVLQF